MPPKPNQHIGIIFAKFVASGFFLATIVEVTGNIIWVDFLHTNPHRTKENALFIIFIMGPILGLITPIIFGLLPIFIASQSSKMIAAIFGRIPTWSIFLMSVLCTVSLIIQLNIIGGFFVSDGESIGSQSELLIYPIHRVQNFSFDLWGFIKGFIGISLLFLIPLFAAWWKVSPRVDTQVKAIN